MTRFTTISIVSVVVLTAFASARAYETFTQEAPAKEPVDRIAASFDRAFRSEQRKPVAPSSVDAPIYVLVNEDLQASVTGLVREDDSVQRPWVASP